MFLCYGETLSRFRSKLDFFTNFNFAQNAMYSCGACQFMKHALWETLVCCLYDYSVDLNQYLHTTLTTMIIYIYCLINHTAR